ncbi:hypothetical protein Mic7113_0685 [Allocoleopsis franciscana PCC 7113]|uniref:Uncharacterized protein n=1 Tax=Allocoleopsis franciscana PCC 7113 TaxID=1173027 RepID=K9W8Q9_9CYAN|nr:hypothetical protein Mic7113_0685 [Allocoleopsis franciscana PCC 7113]
MHIVLKYGKECKNLSQSTEGKGKREIATYNFQPAASNPPTPAKIRKVNVN